MFATRRRCAMRTCLLCSNILQRYPHFLPTFVPSFLPFLGFVSSLWCIYLSTGGAMWGWDGGFGPKGPQPAPVHPAGAEGRPPREERAQGQSVPAAGGAGLLQEVFTCTNMSIWGDDHMITALILIINLSLQWGDRRWHGYSFSVSFSWTEESLPVFSPARVRNQTPVCFTPISHSLRFTGSWNHSHSNGSACAELRLISKDPCMLKLFQMTSEEICKLNQLYGVMKGTLKYNLLFYLLLNSR